MHRFVEHVGEVEIELAAPTREGVFAEAAAALAELIEGAPAGAPEERTIALPPAEPALLLVDWLNELVFLSEVEGFVPHGVTHLELAGGGLHAVVAGSCGRPRHLVKAATLGGLSLEQREGGWHGRVVLDV